MKYKEHDKRILDHIAHYGFITVQQCAAIIYKGHKYAVSEAYRKLNAMLKKEWLRRVKKNNIYIYYCNLESVPGLHKMLLMDFYTELVRNGADIIEFKMEIEWPSVKINTKPMRSDAYIAYKFNGYMAVLLVEVDVTHRYELENYERLYLTHEVQSKLDKEYGSGGYFPLVIVITKKLTPPEHKGNVEVVYLNYDLKDVLSKVLL